MKIGYENGHFHTLFSYSTLSALVDRGSPDFTASIDESSLVSAAPSAASPLCLDLEVGQAFVLHQLTPHVSPPNTTGDWRRALILRYVAPPPQSSYVLHSPWRPGDWTASKYKDGSLFADYCTGVIFQGVGLPGYTPEASE